MGASPGKRRREALKGGRVLRIAFPLLKLFTFLLQRDLETYLFFSSLSFFVKVREQEFAVTPKRPHYAVSGFVLGESFLSDAGPDLAKMPRTA